MLVDETRITVHAGRGGNGVVSFFPMKKGPDGGTGGNGGDVYAIVNSQLPDLHKLAEQRVFKAGNGLPGASFNKKGADGNDLTIQFPKGSVLIDVEKGTEIEVKEKILLCKGGQGGRGNDHFKSSTNQVPLQWEKGRDGEEKHFKVIMRLIADFGLIGLPNAGKSSLLNSLTSAHARIAAYPFTTLEPNLGAINGKIIADIPGLIEGASEGKGLGVKFLKHIEKVSLLIHCIASDSSNIEQDYSIVMKELKNFNQELVNKNKIILLTKSDLAEKNQIQTSMRKLKKYGNDVYSVSIYDEESIKRLSKILR